MSDMLKEKFGELVKEQGITLSEGDPMPTVTASVIPGTGSEPSKISDAQNSGAGGADPQPSVPPTVAIGQSAPTDLGGSTSAPLHDNDEDGEENPGAKAAAPVTPISGDAQQAPMKDPGTPRFTIGTDVAYGTTTGPAVTYPIKPAFEELDVTSDIAALIEGTELSDGFASKATTIFEAAVKVRLQEEWAKLEEAHAEALTAKVAEVKAELQEDVKGTIKYAIGQWLEENQLAVDRGVRNEITSDFIAGLKNLFQEHYINIPEDKEDIVEDLAETNREMETRLNDQIERNLKTVNEKNELHRELALLKLSEGLADTQKDKLASLAQGVTFESVEKYTEAVKTLRESYFPAQGAPQIREETSEDAPEMAAAPSKNPLMDAYVSGISKFGKSSF